MSLLSIDWAILQIRVQSKKNRLGDSSLEDWLVSVNKQGTIGKASVRERGNWNDKGC